MTVGATSSISSVTHRLELPADPRSVMEARRCVHQWMSPFADRYDVANATLLVSELVTNAVVHARSCIVLAMAVQTGGIRFEVQDELPEQAPALSIDGHDELEEHGRGLQLVGALARRWGSYLLLERGGVRTKVVWFELEPSAIALTPHPVPAQPVEQISVRHSDGRAIQL